MLFIKKQIRLLFLFLGCCLLSNMVWAQIGGRSSFDFLRTSPSASITALGGTVVSIKSYDPSVAFRNPSLLNDSMHTRFSASVVNYIADVSYSTFCYAHSLKKQQRVWGGIQSFGYGDFKESDLSGIYSGANYNINSLALVGGYGRSFGKFSLGMNAKILQSVIYRSSTWGFAVDFGASYFNQKSGLSLGAVLQNLGAVSGSSNQTMPVNLEVGISQKLSKAPFRFSLVATNLTRPSMVYVDPNAPAEIDLAGNVVPTKSTVVDNIFRHLIFSTEILLSEYFHLRAGYNHQRRQELNSPNQNLSLDGFTMGFGLRIFRFHLDYGYARFHTSGGMHQFQFATYLNRTFKKIKSPYLNPSMKPETAPLINNPESK